MLINGFDVAKYVTECLKINIGKRKLNEGDNFNDFTLWHASVTGCFAEAGANQNFLIEVCREFGRKRHSDFLNRYLALYRHRRLGIWTDKVRSTEIDVIYLDPIDHSVIAACEYENEEEFYLIADNVVKFHAFSSSTEGNHKPVLCIIGFRWNQNWAIDKLRNLIEMTTGEEKITFRGKKYEFPPLKSWWLLVPFFRKKEIRWEYLIIDPQGKTKEEKEFSLST